MYIEIEIGSEQILNLFENPVELLTPSADGTYYSIDNLIIEKTMNTTNYRFYTPVYIVSHPNNPLIMINDNFWSNVNTVVEISDVNIMYSNVANLYANTSGLGMYLSVIDQNATEGDSTLLVKIWYSLYTFGSLL